MTITSTTLSAMASPPRVETIQAGDIVLVSRGGRRFHGNVRQIRAGVVEFDPIERGISYRHASAREVLDVWHHRLSRRSRSDDEVEPAPEVAKGQLSLAGRLNRSA
jgi:hypothetical protein